MKKAILSPKYLLYQLAAFSFLITTFVSCKKADNFYDTLNALPQINYTSQYAYKTAYIIGDTMVITGSLQPKNNLQITIGGVAASIVKVSSITYNPGYTAVATMDQVSILITKQMEGKSKEVKVLSGGYNTTGTPIDVYTAGGPGSFTDSLKAVAIKTFADNQSVFLYCVNGKGDIYYYAPATKDLRHIKKDGTEEIVYDLTKSLDASNNVVMTTFLAGGVDPQGQYLYFSVNTNSGYRLLQLNLSNRQLSTLNQSTGISAPYEGPINTVNAIVTGIYPDSKGNLYLAIGLGVANYSNTFIPDAIARYTKTDGALTYIFKGFQGTAANNYPGMPGTKLSNTAIKTFCYSPDENIIYAIEYDLISGLNTIELYDPFAGVLLQSFSTKNGKSLYNVIAPFSGLQLNLGNWSQPDQSFGILPMPGKRIQSLLYQFAQGPGINIAAQLGFPKWIVYDFNNQRTYAYASGRFNQGNFIFQPTANLSPRLTAIDALLNYDEDGNLYMTANGKVALVKTQTIQ